MFYWQISNLHKPWMNVVNQIYWEYLISTQICCCILTNHWQKTYEKGNQTSFPWGSSFALKRCFVDYIFPGPTPQYFLEAFLAADKLTTLNAFQQLMVKMKHPRPSEKHVLMRFLVTIWFRKIPLLFSTTAAPSKFCECIAVFFESLFYCFGFCVYLPEQVQKFACCLFVCLNRWSSFPPQINLNHFARRQNRISQRTKQVFQGTLQHGQTVFLFFLKKPNTDDSNMTRICFKKDMDLL